MRKFILASLLLTMVGATAQAQAGEAASVKSIVDNIMQPHLAENNIPGAAVDVYYNGHEYQYFYGYANKTKRVPVRGNTIFDLASISKIFTTTMLALEVKQDKIQLSDPIVKYLPSLANTKGLAIDNVKVLNLATHTASFPRQVEKFGIDKNDEKGLMQQLKTWHPANSVGTRYLYSNVSFGLLGVVVANAAGESYIDFANQQVLSPLHMTNTLIQVPTTKAAQQAQGYDADSEPAAPFVSSNFLYGGGSLRSTSTDMLQFLKANLNIPTGNASPTLLSAMQFAQKAQYNIRPNFIMGLGWQRLKRNGELFVTKNGANVGFTSFIGFSPDKQFGVVVLMNAAQSKAGKVGNQMLNQLAKLN
jgi:beta-lactamase class C